MKEGIHPEYREVCFVDLSNGFKFVTRSCAQTKEKIKMDDGRELPMFKLETTSESHPFYTGTQKSVDSLVVSTLNIGSSRPSSILIDSLVCAHERVTNLKPLDRSTKQTSRYSGWMPSFMGAFA